MGGAATGAAAGARAAEHRGAGAVLPEILLLTAGERPAVYPPYRRAGAASARFSRSAARESLVLRGLPALRRVVCVRRCGSCAACRDCAGDGVQLARLCRRGALFLVCAAGCADFRAAKRRLALRRGHSRRLSLRSAQSVQAHQGAGRDRVRRPPRGGAGAGRVARCGAYGLACRLYRLRLPLRRELRDGLDRAAAAGCVCRRAIAARGARISGGCVCGSLGGRSRRLPRRAARGEPVGGRPHERRAHRQKGFRPAHMDGHRL